MIRGWVRGVLAAVFFSTTAFAHHSFAMFDTSKKFVFTGVVVRVVPNPDHQQIFFVPLNHDRAAIVRDEGGAPVTWMLELEGAGQAAKQGITVDNFPPGTVFSVALFPLRNGQHAGARGRGSGSDGDASALIRCPRDTAPAPGKHCDSVEGAVSHGGSGRLPADAQEWSMTGANDQ